MKTSKISRIIALICVMASILMLPSIAFAAPLASGEYTNTLNLESPDVSYVPIYNRLTVDNKIMKPQDMTYYEGILLVGYTQAGPNKGQDEESAIARYNLSGGLLDKSQKQNLGHYTTLTQEGGYLWAADLGVIRQLYTRDGFSTYTTADSYKFSSWENAWGHMVGIDDAHASSGRTKTLVTTRRPSNTGTMTFYVRKYQKGWPALERYTLPNSPSVTKGGVKQFIRGTMQGMEIADNRMYVLADLDQNNHVIYVIDPRDGVVLSVCRFTNAGETNGITIGNGVVYIGCKRSGEHRIYKLIQRGGLKPALSQGWKKESNGKWWYRYKDGSYPKNAWQYESGHWYYFDGSGWMVTGTRVIGGKTYTFNSSGHCANPWQ